MRRGLVISVLSVLLLPGCQYKDLCYDHNHWVNVNVVYDWSMPKGGSKAEEVDGMSVLFYSEKYAEPVRYDLPGRDGGKVRLLPATYTALSYNNDTETILLRGMEKLETAEAYTRMSSMGEGTRLRTKGEFPRAKGTEDEPVILEPDMLWSAVGAPDRLEIGDPDHAMTLVMKQRVTEITITIYNVPNLEYTGQFGGALTGLASSVNLTTGALSNECATQAFPIDVKDGNTLQMKFRIFGHCPHQDKGDIHEHQLTIYAILADGSQWYYTQDVTESMHDPAHHHEEGEVHEIHIELEDPLPIPKPIVNGSGLHPTVDDWQGIEIEIGMD